ncbi:TonB-dependent receptor [Seohaeicola saemankumensis]|nr:TonB-dependent receptor [Seohaeicola saemankumensis]MCA0870061.1 TonB-dependent receptor [Seohaeicola saemankumensis]
MFRTGKAVLMATVAMSAGAPLAAQEVFDLDPIRVEAEEAQATLGNRVIGTEQIEERNPATMADVFNGESAIITSGGASIAQKIMVQGIEESLLSVTIDGARQNKSAFHHTGNVLMDPTLLKQVEVTSGLAPADAGPGALAGSIAYETKDARDFLEPGDPFGGQATLSYGDNAQDFRRSLTLAGQSGGFEWLLSGTRLTGDDYSDGDGNVVRGTGADLSSVMAKIAYTTETGKRFQFSAEEVRDEGVRAMQMGPGGLYYARPDFEGVVGRPSVYREALSRRRSYNFIYTDEAPQGVFAPTVQLSYNEQYVEAGAAVGTNASLSGKVENDFDMGNGVLTAGIDFFHDTATGEGVLNTGSPEETLDNIGIYAQMRQDVTERVSLSYGARIDSQRFELADGQSFSETGISLNGQADVILSDAWTLNFGLASSWGGYELSEASLINLGSPWVYGTPEPSRANNARIGLRYDSGPWAVRGALFYTEIEDVNDVLSAARSLATLTSKGFDGSVAYFAANGYLRMNYTYADVTLDGAPIGSTAYYYGRPVGHMIGLEGAYALSPQWVVGGSAEIALENNDTAVALPGYEVVNLFAAYSPPGYEQVELRLDARNIFNETYAARGSDGIDLPSRIVALNEPGRTVSLTASLKF